MEDINVKRDWEEDMGLKKERDGKTWVQKETGVEDMDAKRDRYGRHESKERP